MYEWSNSSDPVQRQSALISQLAFHERFVTYLKKRIEELDGEIKQATKKVKHKKRKGKKKSKRNSEVKD